MNDMEVVVWTVSTRSGPRINPGDTDRNLASFGAPIFCLLTIFILVGLTLGRTGSDLIECDDTKDAWSKRSESVLRPRSLFRLSISESDSSVALASSDFSFRSSVVASGGISDKSRLLLALGAGGSPGLMIIWLALSEEEDDEEAVDRATLCRLAGSCCANSNDWRRSGKFLRFFWQSDSAGSRLKKLLSSSLKSVMSSFLAKLTSLKVDSSIVLSHMFLSESKVDVWSS
ncbi:hypothetical protein BpHYR1_014594 [Brachionus plicatilis]|uniref:Uncharacterized protein n=1 Tax=Brachionus plicatilis TaxID=10195 RepID=A0A3M7PVH7_BRAPC|nr:hypothetical protein BpHYR1_014594 [Brachionus plicatilis]